MLSFGEAKQTLESAGQAHVLQFWPELSEEERDSFLRELAQLDLRGLRGHCEAAAAAAASPPSRMDRDMEPIPPELIGSSRKSDRKAVCQWESEGNTCKLWTAEVFKSFKINIKVIEVNAPSIVNLCAKQNERKARQTGQLICRLLKFRVSICTTKRFLLQVQRPNPVSQLLRTREQHGFSEVLLFYMNISRIISLVQLFIFTLCNKKEEVAQGNPASVLSREKRTLNKWKTFI